MSRFPIKVVAGKCNPWLHFIPQQGLALVDRSGKISTPGCRPPDPPDLYFTQKGHLSWFPLVPSDWGIWAHPRRLIRIPVRAGYPRYHTTLSPPGRVSLLVPLPLDLSTSLPQEFFPLLSVCSLCSTWHRTFMRNNCQLEEFIKKEIFSILTTVFKNHDNP